MAYRNAFRSAGSVCVTRSVARSRGSRHLAQQHTDCSCDVCQQFSASDSVENTSLKYACLASQAQALP